MSLSCRSQRGDSRSLVGATVWVLATLAASTVWAADSYFIPEVEASVVSHSNPELVPTGRDSASGYTGSVGGVLGTRSQRAVLEVRPWIQYESFSGRPELRHVNQYLSANSRYDTLVSEWSLIANYSRENSYTAQRPEAAYDDFDPDNPVVDSTGRITVVSQVFTRTQVRPKYLRNFSERFGLEINGLYQDTTVDSDVVTGDASDYRDLEAEALLFWNWRQRTRLAAGLYSARYEADKGVAVTTGKGLNFQAYRNWSQTLSGGLSVNFERTNVRDAGPVQDPDSSNVSASFGLQRRTQTGTFRLDAGRIFSPSTSGARATIDQLRLQYYEQFRPLWSYLVAVRGFRSRDQGVTSGRSDRDYATAYFRLSRELTRNWYVNGNYSYTTQKYVGTSGANDSTFQVGVGFRGLEPQR